MQSVQDFILHSRVFEFISKPSVAQSVQDSILHSRNFEFTPRTLWNAIKNYCGVAHHSYNRPNSYNTN
jgi:hypothetical protein